MWAAVPCVVMLGPYTIFRQVPRHACTAEACPYWRGIFLETLCCVSMQEYLGITGNPKFNALSAQLAFGEGSPVIKEGRNATVQCLSGTGSLRVSHSLTCP